MGKLGSDVGMIKSAATLSAASHYNVKAADHMTLLHDSNVCALTRLSCDWGGIKRLIE